MESLLEIFGKVFLFSDPKTKLIQTIVFSIIQTGFSDFYIFF